MLAVRPPHPPDPAQPDSSRGGPPRQQRPPGSFGGRRCLAAAHSRPSTRDQSAGSRPCWV